MEVGKGREQERKLTPLRGETGISKMQVYSSDHDISSLQIKNPARSQGFLFEIIYFNN